jgi:hypothetical protein
VRVDLVVTTEGPQVMEVELVEPQLFFGPAPASLPRMIDAMCREAQRLKTPTEVRA